MAARETTMHQSNRSALGTLCRVLFMGWVFSSPAVAQESPAASTWGCTEMEAFLHAAKVGRQHELPVGITLPTRATLDDGTRTHDAAFQIVDESKVTMTTTSGTELNFRDTWKFNVAGYELAKLLELNMVPPYVEREVSGKPASLSWWVDGAMMELDRYKRKLNPPDIGSWNQQMYAVRVFHELIYEMDPNLSNLLITGDWQILMIDFTRAFRLMKEIRHPKDLVMCDRRLLTRMRALTPDVVQQKLGKWLKKEEGEAVVARAGLIVKLFDEAVAKKGEAAVLYDLPRTSQPCGSGLK